MSNIKIHTNDMQENQDSPKTELTAKQKLMRDAGAMRRGVERYIAAGSVKAWSQDLHCDFLARFIGTVLDLPSEEIGWLRTQLLLRGLGGNASQFSQFLHKEKILLKQDKAQAIADIVEKLSL